MMIASTYLRDLRSQGELLRRGLWLLMVAAHAPACWGAWRSLLAAGSDGSRLGACLALTLAIAFFALKVLDVAWLRFRTDRRSVVALLVIVAVLHVDLIRSDNAPPLLAESTALVATTWLLSLAEPIRRLIKVAIVTAAATLRHTLTLSRSNDAVWLDAFHPRCWLLILRPHLLRAPPA